LYFLIDLVQTPDQGARFVIGATFDDRALSHGGAYFEYGNVVRPNALVEDQRFRDALFGISLEYVKPNELID
jgi:hypothetical protein